MTVSAEDCADLVTGEVVALYDAWLKVNENDQGNSKGRIFFAKAVIILATARHSRVADELNLLVSDRLPDELTHNRFDNQGARRPHLGSARQTVRRRAPSRVVRS